MFRKISMRPSERYIELGREYIKLGELSREFVDKLFAKDFDMKEWIQNHTEAPLVQLKKIIVKEIESYPADNKYKFKLRIEMLSAFAGIN